MENKNIFVSHYHDDANEIDKLKQMIGSGKQYEPKDSSIYEDKNPNKAENIDYIKSLLRPKIKWAGSFIVLIGDNTSKSDWVQWEIEYANSLGKNIVGVYLPDYKGNEIPEALSDYADSVVDWDANQMNGALSGNSEYCERFRNSIKIPLSRENC